VHEDRGLGGIECRFDMAKSCVAATPWNDGSQVNAVMYRQHSRRGQASKGTCSRPMLLSWSRSLGRSCIYVATIRNASIAVHEVRNFLGLAARELWTYLPRLVFEASAVRHN